MRRILLLILVVLLVGVTSAEPIYANVNENFKVSIPVFTNNMSSCSNCDCDISINYPNGTRSISKHNASVVNGQTNYTFNQTFHKVNGDYATTIHCISGSDNGFTTYVLRLNPTGEEVTTEQTYLYILGLFFLLLLIFGTVFLIGKLPSNDSVDDRNMILQVNQLKHLRKVLWVVVWGLSMAIVFVISNIALAFLTNEMLGNLFFTFYQIMFWATVIMLPLWLIWIFYSIWQDREVKKMLNRGIEVGGNSF